LRKNGEKTGLFYYFTFFLKLLQKTEIERSPMHTLIKRTIPASDIADPKQFNVAEWARARDDREILSVVRALGEKEASWATSLLPSHGPHAEPIWRLVIRVFWHNKQSEFLHCIEFGIS
jgi:hypothetical protein